MSNNEKPPGPPNPAETPAAPAQASPKPKRKLTLDVTDVSEVLERKISP